MPVVLKLKPTRDAGELREIVAIADGYAFVAGFAINLPAGKPEDLVLAVAALAPERLPGAVGGPPVEEYVNAILAALYGISAGRPVRAMAAGGVRQPPTPTACCGGRDRRAALHRACVPRPGRRQGDPAELRRRRRDGSNASRTPWALRTGPERFP